MLRKNVAEGKLASAEEKASRMIKEAEETIEAKKKESLMEAKDDRNAVWFRKKKTWTVR